MAINEEICEILSNSDWINEYRNFVKSFLTGELHINSFQEIEIRLLLQRLNASLDEALKFVDVTINLEPQNQWDSNQRQLYKIHLKKIVDLYLSIKEGMMALKQLYPNPHNFHKVLPSIDVMNANIASKIDPLILHRVALKELNCIDFDTKYPCSHEQLAQVNAAFKQAVKFDEMLNEFESVMNSLGNLNTILDFWENQKIAIVEARKEIDLLKEARAKIEEKAKKDENYSLKDLRKIFDEKVTSAREMLVGNNLTQFLDSLRAISVAAQDHQDHFKLKSNYELESIDCKIDEKEKSFQILLGDDYSILKRFYSKGCDANRSQLGRRAVEIMDNFDSFTSHNKPLPPRLELLKLFVDSFVFLESFSGYWEALLKASQMDNLQVSYLEGRLVLCLEAFPVLKKTLNSLYSILDEQLKVIQSAEYRSKFEKLISSFKVNVVKANTEYEDLKSKLELITQDHTQAIMLTSNHQELTPESENTSLTTSSGFNLASTDHRELKKGLDITTNRVEQTLELLSSIQDILQKIFHKTQKRPFTDTQFVQDVKKVIEKMQKSCEFESTIAALETRINQANAVGYDDGIACYIEEEYGASLRTSNSQDTTTPRFAARHQHLGEMHEFSSKHRLGEPNYSRHPKSLLEQAATELEMKFAQLLTDSREEEKNRFVKFSNDYTELLERLNQLKNRLERLISNTKAEIENKNTVHQETLNKEIVGYNNQVREWGNTLSEIHSSREKLTQSLTVTEEKNRVLTNEVAALRYELQLSKRNLETKNTLGEQSQSGLNEQSTQLECVKDIQPAQNQGHNQTTNRPHIRRFSSPCITPVPSKNSDAQSQLDSSEKGQQSCNFR